MVFVWLKLPQGLVDDYCVSRSQLSPVVWSVGCSLCEQGIWEFTQSKHFFHSGLFLNCTCIHYESEIAKLRPLAGLGCNESAKIWLILIHLEKRGYAELEIYIGYIQLKLNFSKPSIQKKFSLKLWILRYSIKSRGIHVHVKYLYNLINADQTNYWNLTWLFLCESFQNDITVSSGEID